ncbi:hypothetical protein KUCAC02_030740 [Chaenocephalus aceratus]|uniref:Uncharacterized protein n=1 Tax=Chaenocephalus aceratus TaxID=36190 RepID=A0ACB9XLW4_CHAAC|nr:hypothetical protein KUCAC02_030740 [Chaenocephalus aceratus]
MVAGHPKRWDQVLQSTMFALRTKKQLTTKYSPYYLMFGREARYPSEVPEEYVVKEDKVSKLVEREEIHEGLKKQEAVFTEVKNNMKTSQDKVRKRKIERGQEDNFQPEERIPAKLQKLSDPSPLAGPQHTKTHIHSTQTPTTQTPQVAPPSMDCEAQMAPKDPELCNNSTNMDREEKTHALEVVGGRDRQFIFNHGGKESWRSNHRLLPHDVALGGNPQRFFEKVGPFQTRCGSWTVCHNGHWTLIIMYLKERRSLFVDPFEATDAQIDKCKDVTGLQSRYCLGKPWHIQLTRWVVADAMLRMHMAMSQVTNSDDLSQLCRACGELSSLAEGDIDTWIECTTCQMWYHLGCVGLASPTEDDYFCPSCKS